MTSVTCHIIRADDPRMSGAYALRYAVFVQEQGVPLELERDAEDAGATHLVALSSDGDVVGTLRMVLKVASAAPRVPATHAAHDDPVPPDPDDLGHYGKVGRVAVRAEQRRRGLGAMMMRHIIDHARALDLDHLFLHAQLDATALYESVDFVFEGAPFDEAGIPHISMRLPLRLAH